MGGAGLPGSLEITCAKATAPMARDSRGGNRSRARSITDLEIPALEGGYAAFYNPGGPGQTPTSGVRYTAPGPPRMQPVTIAIDDPMRVTRD